jgi:hypothetical protein
MNFQNLLKQANYTLLLPRTGIQPLSLVLRQEKNWFQWLRFQADEGELLYAAIPDLFKSDYFPFAKSQIKHQPCR